MPLTDPSRPLRDTLAELDRLRAENATLHLRLATITDHLAARQLARGPLPSIGYYLAHLDVHAPEARALIARLGSGNTANAGRDPLITLDLFGTVRLTLDDSVLTAP